MKCWIFLITILFIHFHSYCACAIGSEACPPENCVTPDQCEYANNLQTCGPSKICCSVVKFEYRTACRHHGGECVSSFCNPNLIRSVNDCPSGTHCCVLV